MPFHGRVWFCVECHDNRHEECLGEAGEWCECWCREERREDDDLPSRDEDVE